MKLPSESSCGKDQCIDSTVCSYPLVIGANPVDYSEYMWMGEEMEEFDRKVNLYKYDIPNLKLQYIFLHK